MRRPHTPRRTILALLATGALAAGVTYAAQATARGTTPMLNACAKKTDGTLHLVAGASVCTAKETAVSWPAQASSSAAAVTHLQSPNGLFKIDVTDSGIVLTSPTGTVTLDRSTVKVNAATFQVRASSQVDMRGGLMLLNAGGKPVARVGDSVVNGKIATGSGTVSAG